jgi:hypothetical protein
MSALFAAYGSLWRDLVFSAAGFLVGFGWAARLYVRRNGP